MEDQLNQVKEFYSRRKRLPSFSEMTNIFGLKSKSSVSYIVHQWIYDGVFQMEGNNLTPGDEFFRLPLLGVIRAGEPADATLYSNEGIVLDHYFNKHPGFTYILRVAGDSMINEGIMPGDLVILDKMIEPSNGDVVAAYIDGAWTLKYFRKDQQKVYLEAANPNYPTFHPKEQLEIGGVVIKVIREYH